MAADSRKHDSSQIAFQQTVRLGEGLVESGAFFKFARIDIRLAQHLLGGFAALGAHRVEFKNDSGCPANRQFNVLLSLSHADRFASPSPPRYVQKADSPISVCLTSLKLHFPGQFGTILTVKEKPKAIEFALVQTHFLLFGPSRRLESAKVLEYLRSS